MGMLFLAQTQRMLAGCKRTIVFMDSGDTLIDEGTERRGADRIVHTAQLIDGAKETLCALHRAGYTIALVADGERASFDNMYSQHGLSHCFAARSISSDVGVQKPDAAMFQTAMDALGLTDVDKSRIVMVGNNVRKDIAGANRFGIRSVLLDWSPRYHMIPANAEETPEFVIHTPGELLAVIDAMEAAQQPVQDRSCAV